MVGTRIVFLAMIMVTAGLQAAPPALASGSCTGSITMGWTWPSGPTQDPITYAQASWTASEPAYAAGTCEVGFLTTCEMLVDGSPAAATCEMVSWPGSRCELPCNADGWIEANLLVPLTPGVHTFQATVGITWDSWAVWYPPSGPNEVRGSATWSAEYHPCTDVPDPNTLEGCGAGPVCPSGVTSPPGPGQVAVVCGVPLSVGAPTGVKSCAVYNAQYAPAPYPGQDTGVVVEYAPAGPAGDVPACAGAVTGPPCEPGQPGLLLNNLPLCVPDPCPAGVDEETLAACGAGPFCAEGVSNADPATVSACGIGPVCPSGISSPPGPGQLVVVCGEPIPDPCPGGAGTVDPNTIEACGAGPVCPQGISSPPGPGQLAVVCGAAVTACSLGGTGPGPGWTVGAQGVCVGLPWAQSGAASCPGATANVRVHWGTTPGFPPGSTLDVCL